MQIKKSSKVFSCTEKFIGFHRVYSTFAYQVTLFDKIKKYFDRVYRERFTCKLKELVGIAKCREGLLFCPNSFRSYVENQPILVNFESTDFHAKWTGLIYSHFPS